MKFGLVRQPLNDTDRVVRRHDQRIGRAFVVGDELVPVVFCNTEFVGDSSALPSASPMSQLLIGITRQAGDSGDRGQVPRAGPVVPEDVVEQQRVAEGRRATRQGVLQCSTVLRRRQPGRCRLSVRREGGRRGHVLHHRVVEEADVRRVVEGDSTTFVGRHVVRDHVVVDVHREVPGHQEAEPATVVVGQVRLDDVVVDAHCTATRRERRRGRSAGRRRS